MNVRIVEIIITKLIVSVFSLFFFSIFNVHKKLTIFVIKPIAIIIVSRFHLPEDLFFLCVFLTQSGQNQGSLSFGGFVIPTHTLHTGRGGRDTGEDSITVRPLYNIALGSAPIH